MFTFQYGEIKRNGGDHYEDEYIMFTFQYGEIKSC